MNDNKPGLLGPYGGWRSEAAAKSRRLLMMASIVPVLALGLTACERPPVESTQVGYRGTGMELVVNPRVAAEVEANTRVPASALPPAADGGPMAKDVYQNVQVLTDLNVAQFTRLMLNITAWVSPEQGCNYCHQGNNFAEDDLYTKRVARKMLQMTRTINQDWSAHVKDTGVSCYTCHRGQPNPAQVWFDTPGQPALASNAGITYGQNDPVARNGLSSLPLDSYLNNKEPIRVAGKTALPHEETTKATIRETEGSYGLMMYFSHSLNVNCTYCHNTRAFSSWEQSSPQRVQAWHGIQMTQSVNASYVQPLLSDLPAHRLGPTGDVPKVGCATCHQQQNKPLLGAPMLVDNPELKAKAQ